MSSRVIRFGLLASSLIAVQSCSSSTDTSDTSAISLALNSATAAVEPGSSVLVPGVLTRTNFTGDVTYTLDDAPAGVTGGILIVPATTTTPFNFLVSTTAAVALGTYTVMVRATGSNVTDATAKLTLTVAAVVPSDIVSLAASPTTLSLTVGGPGATTTITPTFLAGYTGGFGVSPSGLPAGLTPAIAINGSGSTATITLTLTPSTGLIAGTYPIVVTATAIDHIARSVTVTVTVQ